MIRYHDASSRRRNARQVRVADRASDIHPLQNSVEDVSAIRLAGGTVDLAQLVKREQLFQNGIDRGGENAKRPAVSLSSVDEGPSAALGRVLLLSLPQAGRRKLVAAAVSLD